MRLCKQMRCCGGHLAPLCTNEVLGGTPLGPSTTESVNRWKNKVLLQYARNCSKGVLLRNVRSYCRAALLHCCCNTVSIVLLMEVAPLLHTTVHTAMLKLQCGNSRPAPPLQQCCCLGIVTIFQQYSSNIPIFSRCREKPNDKLSHQTAHSVDSHFCMDIHAKPEYS